MKSSTKDPEARRFLGLEGDFGKLLGVDNDWAYRIVKDIGNYGESYDATFGDKGGLGLPRGMNNLYSNGGLMHDAQPGSDRLTWSGDRPRAHARRNGCCSRPWWRSPGISARRPPRTSARRHATFGFGFLAETDQFRHSVPADPVVGRRYLCPRAAGLRAEHAAGRCDEHRRRDAARACWSASCGCRRTGWCATSHSASSSWCATRRSWCRSSSGTWRCCRRCRDLARASMLPAGVC